MRLLVLVVTLLIAIGTTLAVAWYLYQRSPDDGGLVLLLGSGFLIVPTLYRLLHATLTAVEEPKDDDG